MNKGRILLALYKSGSEIFQPIPDEYKPNNFLRAKGIENLEQFWQNKVEETKNLIQANVWRGELLPTGYPAPSEARIGESYVIVSPSGTIIFQYNNSPYAPETPGLAPGVLTSENVEIAMKKHVEAIAEQLVLDQLISDYLDWLSENLL